MRIYGGLYLLLCSTLLSGSVSAASASDLQVYVRGLAGISSSFGTSFEDANCLSTRPAAYFACGPGVDGRQRGAYGDLGQTALLEAGLGIEVTDYLRVEAVLDYRPGFAFDGNANFLRSGADQPVSGDVTQAGMMAFAHLEPLTALGVITPIRPFIGAGAGASWNEIGEMTYEFPALTQPRYSLMPGGQRTSFAWSVVGGAAYDISDLLTLEVSYRYSDLGEVRTDEGILFVQKSSGTLEIPIAETKASLTEQSVAVSFRWRLWP
jgi:opacity protein-like surface antigen